MQVHCECKHLKHWRVWLNPRCWANSERMIRPFRGSVEQGPNQQKQTPGGLKMSAMKCVRSIFDHCGCIRQCNTISERKKANSQRKVLRQWVTKCVTSRDHPCQRQWQLRDKTCDKKCDKHRPSTSKAVTIVWQKVWQQYARLSKTLVARNSLVSNVSPLTAASNDHRTNSTR